MGTHFGNAMQLGLISANPCCGAANCTVQPFPNLQHMLQCAVQMYDSIGSLHP